LVERRGRGLDPDELAALPRLLQLLPPQHPAGPLVGLGAVAVLRLRPLRRRLQPLVRQREPVRELRDRRGLRRRRHLTRPTSSPLSESPSAPPPPRPVMRPAGAAPCCVPFPGDC